MGLYNSFKEAFLNRFGSIQITGDLLLNLVIALILLVLGIFIGKSIKYLLRKLIEKLKITKIINKPVIDMILIIIKWSIYILFINFALTQLAIPLFTGWLTTILSIIPTITGSLIVIVVGFSLSVVVRRTILESNFKDNVLLSEILFYFINYIFIVFALKMALIFLKDMFIINSLTIVFTVFGLVALLVYIYKNQNK